MQISVNHSLFYRATAFIGATGRVDMQHWAGIRDAVPATFAGEIRMIPLFLHPQARACVGGWVCFLATEGEMASAIGAYGLTPDVVDDPETIAAAILLRGASDIREAV